MRLFTIVFLMSLAFAGFAQTKTISGKVLDENGEGLPGATLRVQGTTDGTIADMDGKFTVKTSVDQGVLVCSFIGYVTQQQNFQKETQLTFTLQPDVSELDEVVVIGYGTQKKSDLTGATGVVSSKDVDLQPVQRVQNMLQGKVAGVMVQQNSGAPGAAAKVNIRGFTGDPVYVINGFIGADINSVNPNDIESISVLKDASATAIYGARGANGVILVTTKSAQKSSKLKVSADYYHSLSQVYRRLDLMDPISYMKVVNKKLQEGGANPIFSNSDILKAASTPGYGTDWQKAAFQNANTDNLNVDLSKGWKTTSMRFSLGARELSGIIRNTNYGRYTSRLDINSNLTKKTKFSLNASYSLIKSHNVNNTSGQGGGKIVESAMSWEPNVPIINPATGDYTGTQGYGATVIGNPSFLINENNSYTTSNNLNAMLSLEHELFNGFSLRLFGASQSNFSNKHGFSRYLPASKAPSTGDQSNSHDYKNQGDFQIKYNKDFGDHHLDATGVFEVISWSSLQKITNFTYPRDSSETIVQHPIPNYKPQGMMSFLTRVGYSYKDKLMFTGSLRHDGSSRLPPGNKWGTFGSASVAYALSKESFLKGNSTITNLKLRGGFGQIGNVNSISAFQVQNLTNPMPYALAFQGYNLVPATFFEDGNNRANSNLKWEVSSQWNGGVDLELWKGMLQFTGDYYVKYTDKILFKKQVPSFLGGGSIYSNSGRVQNHGVELQLIHKWHSGKDFSMRTNFNVTFNRSKVLKLPRDTVYVGDVIDRQSHVLIKGQQVGNLWGYQYLGPKVADAPMKPGEVSNLNPGDAIYQDTNHDGQITIEDMVVLGNGNPRMVWGFNTYINYKNFSFNLFIQGVHGVDVWNLAYNGLLGGGTGVLDATSTEIFKSWSFDQSGAGGLPSLTAQYKLQSSIYVQNGNFIRGKNATLAYEFNDKALDKLHMGRLRVYLSVQNFYTISKYVGYDPAAHGGSNFAPGVDKGSFPQPISYTAGLNIGF